MKKLKLLLFFTLLFLFIPKIHALETETIYATMSSNGTLSDSGKYKNVSSNGTLSTNSVGTTYQGKSYGMNFYFEETMVNTQVYNLKITFMADDLLPRVNTSYIGIRTYNSNGGNQEDATIVSIVKNTTSSNATTLQINFIPLSACAKVNVILGSENGPVQITGDTTFGIRKVEIGNSSAEGTEQIITNNNQNTQIIITNQDNNTQNIIDNQNEIAEQQHEEQQVCENIDRINIVQDGKVLNNNGTIDINYDAGVTDYININNATIEVLDSYSSVTYMRTCFYNVNKTLISCDPITNLGFFTPPNNSYYMRASINKIANKPRFKICKNGNQALSDTQKETNDILTDDDIGSSASDMGDFLNGFSTNTFGLTSIVTAPLNLIQSLTSSTCSKLELPLPYLNNKKIELPCMTPIYQSTFGSLFTMYQTITFGIIAYWVCVRIFNMVKDFKNPEHDEIEVVDL